MYITSGYLVASIFGIKADDVVFEKLAAEYNITDVVAAMRGVVFSPSGDKGRLQDALQNGRRSLELRYSL